MRVGPNQIYKWLGAKSNPRLDTLFRIATALDVSVGALITGVNDVYDEQRRRGTYRQQLLERLPDLSDAQCRVLLETARIFLGEDDAPLRPPEESR
jgi:transcriptional regulator with XRE-family HTH domain